MRRVVRSIVVTLVLTSSAALIGVPPAAAATCSVPSASHATIQSAIADGGCATITVAAGTFVENLSISRDLSIRGAGVGKTIVDAKTTGRAMTVGAATVEASGMTITGASTSLEGGGISSYGDLTLGRVAVTGNTTSATSAGGISASGTLTITNSSISNNAVTADPSGGAGGLYFSGGTLTITNSTFSGNSAPYRAGAMHVSGGTTATLTNVTVSGNSSATGSGADQGSAVMFASTGTTATIKNSTFAGNTSGDSAITTLIVFAPATATITQSILADSDATGPVCSVAGTTSGGQNITSDASCSLAGSGDLTNTDPALGSLASNGGPVKTHALLAGSLAIDHGFAAGPNCGGTDARGVPRPQNGNCDTGAYELALCNGTVVNRVGTEGNDKLTGASGKDGFLALGGRDAITGKAGNDRICAGEGNDVAHGGTGSDYVFGGDGNDDLFGEDDKDYLYGEAGDDLLNGGPMSDVCSGGPGSDTLRACEI